MVMCKSFVLFSIELLRFELSLALLVGVIVCNGNELSKYAVKRWTTTIFHISTTYLCSMVFLLLPFSARLSMPYTSVAPFMIYTLRHISAHLRQLYCFYCRTSNIYFQQFDFALFVSSPSSCWACLYANTLDMARWRERERERNSFCLSIRLLWLGWRHAFNPSFPILCVAPK